MKALPSWIDEALGDVDEVHAVFDQQDSGNVGFGITRGRARAFVKYATKAEGRAGLARAVQLHAKVTHPTIVPLLQVLPSSNGMALLYQWVDGDLLYAPGPDRRRAASAASRFRGMPPTRICAALDDLFDAHEAIAAAGFVSSDFYDGCMIYDFGRHKLWLIDLDEYRPGPFRLDVDRARGSTRFMAPEEYERGATIDERTTVFHLARAASVLLGDGGFGGFRGSSAQYEVARAGQAHEPSARFQTVAAWTMAWRSAAG